MITTDVTVIGGGPVGLFCAFECGLMGLDCVLIEALTDMGGQCMALYPEKEILDIPGAPHVLAKDLIASLIKQAKYFDQKYLLGHKVVSLTEGSSDNLWALKTNGGETVISKSVVIATGGGSFEFNKIPLPEAAQFEGASLFYALKNKSEMKGKTVSIIGGGDAALDWTIALADITNCINLIHRRDDFKAAPNSLNKLKTLSDEGKVRIFTPFRLNSLQGRDNQLRSITITSNKDSSEAGQQNNLILNTDILLAFFGLAAAKNHFEEWGINVTGNKIPVDKVTYMTNKSLVYAIGDIASYEGKVTSLLSGFAEGAALARTIRKILCPNKAAYSCH